MTSERLNRLIGVALAVATSYCVILYVFTPPTNMCQMTFMMEPPKFIPVAVQEDITIKGHPNSLNSQGDSPYKLYMYSEFGFPMASNIKHDLKDSMPVLFVPGNAGSYQQVRSIASTCIRRQLQSLDAFKFIFYTIDFKNELSAISGGLIEQHTSFVFKSLKQIIRNHPSQTNGVILIGHSVGGFISKALFTIPGFDPNSVPLLVSLASPLIKPYISFDDKMHELYAKTNEYWENMRSQSSGKNIAISISGGQSDRLVPTHLSMDPQFDLSLTTSSIKDVWMDTDHVSITWCRELMNKLSRLLSALMDKKQTRLINDKQLAMSIIEKELLVNYDQTEESAISFKNLEERSWKSSKPFKLLNLDKFAIISRSQLSENVNVFNVTDRNQKDLLVWIDHITPLKKGSVFSCGKLEAKEGIIDCVGRVDLIEMTHPLPTRGFETKKTAVKLRQNENFSSNFIVFDFYNIRNSNPSVGGPPELVTVQETDFSRRKAVIMPSLIGYLAKKFFWFRSEKVSVTEPEENSPMVYTRIDILDSRRQTNFLSIRHETHQCSQVKHQFGTTVSLQQGGYLIEGSQPDKDENTRENSPVSLIKLNSVGKLIGANKLSQNQKLDELFLESFVPGNCYSSIEIELDMMDMVNWIIQNNLSQILTCTSFLAYSSIVAATLRVRQTNEQGHDRTINKLFELLGFILIQSMKTFTNYPAISKTDSQRNQMELDSYQFFDMIYNWTLIYLTSNGLLSCLKFHIRRLIDIAFLLDSVQSRFRRAVCRFSNRHRLKQTRNSSNHDCETSNHIKISQDKADDLVNLDFDWPLIGVTIAGSIVISPALLSILSLFILLKLGLSVAVLSRNISKTNESQMSSNYNDLRNDRIHDLIVSLAALCLLALISNIPAVLLRLRSHNSNSSLVLYGDPNFLSSIISLLLVKVVCEIIQFNYIEEGRKKTTTPNEDQQQLTFRSLWWRFSRLLPNKYSHLMALAPIMFIDTNICHMNHILFVSLLWVDCRLLSTAA